MRHQELRILVTEEHPGDCDEAAAELGDLGHVVHRCHPEGAASPERSCIAWQPGGRCPLKTEPIDIVIDVRSAYGPETPREHGAMCALLANVPLVVCGPVDTGNSALLRADVACHRTRLVLACHTAASAVGPTAHRAVTEALRAALTGLGEPPPLTVHLELRDTTVVADITIGAAPTATTYTRVRAATRTALSRFTPTWPYTPVMVHHVRPASTTVVRP